MTMTLLKLQLKMIKILSGKFEADITKLINFMWQECVCSLHCHIRKKIFKYK